jgi:hypothetical protein
MELKLITLNEKPSAIPQEVFWAYYQGFNDAKEAQAKLTANQILALWKDHNVSITEFVKELRRLAK